MIFRSLSLTLGLALVLAGDVSAGVIADYSADFQDLAPKAGWTYQWNRGPIGDPSNYQDLLWWASGSCYIASLQAYPDESSQAGYVALSNGKNSHTGSPETDSSPAAFAIAGYKVQPGEAGTGSITKSSIRVPLVGEGSDGVEVHVYVNQTLKKTVLVTNPTGSFDLGLGKLAAGDRVYVAVGPFASNGFDGFQISYQITVVP